MTEQEKKMWEQDVEMIAMLNDQNKDLQERIDKAIEYVNNHIHQETFTGYMDSYELKKLLDILRGE